MKEAFIPEWAFSDGYEPGTDWEHQPESTEAGYAYWYWCDDCGQFHQEWLVPGYIIEDGQFYVGDWTADHDGNWDGPGDWQLITSEGELDKYERERLEEIERGRIEYLRDVAETGDDYLGYFCTRRKEKITERWQVRLSNSILGPVLRDGRKDGRGKFVSAEDIPQELTYFLMVGRRGDRWIAGHTLDGKPVEHPMTLRQIECSDGVTAQRLVRPQDDGVHLKIMVKIERVVERRVAKAVLRKRARKVLSQAKHAKEGSHG